MLILASTLLTSSALANPCDPAYPTACVAPTANVDGSATIGAGATVGGYAAIGASVAMGDVTVGASATIAGPTVGTIGDGSVIGRRVVVGPNADIGTDVTLGRNTTVGSDLVADDNAFAGFQTQIGNNVWLQSGARLGNYAQVGDDTTIDARIGRMSTIGAGTVVTANVAPEATIGRDAVIDGAVQRGAVIADEAEVELGARVGRGASVAHGAVVEAGAIIRPNATVPVCTLVPSDAFVPRGADYTGGPVPGCTLPAAFSPWFQHLPSPNLHIDAIDIDDSGDLFVTGQFLTSATAGTESITGTTQYSPFVGRLDANGDAQWLVALPSPNDTAGGLGIAVGGGTVYVTGSFENTIELPDGVPDLVASTPNSPDGFIVGLDASDGTVRFGHAFGSTNQDFGNGVVADASGAYVVGDFSTSVTFGADTLVSAGSIDAFVTKVDANGTFLWSRRAGSAQQEGAPAVAMADNGDVFVPVRMAGSAFTDTGDGLSMATSITAAQVNGIALVRLSPSGATISATEIANNTQMRPFAIDVHGDRVAIGADYGNFGADQTLGPDTIPGGTSDRSTLVILTDLAGTVQRAWPVGVADDENFPAGIVLNDDSIYVSVAGEHGSTVSFGTTSFSSPYRFMSLARIDRTAGDWDWAIRTDWGPQPAIVEPGGLALRTFNGDDHLYAVGVYTRFPIFGSLPVTSVGSSAVGYIAHLLGDGVW